MSWLPPLERGRRARLRFPAVGLLVSVWAATWALNGAIGLDAQRQTLACGSTEIRSGTRKRLVPGNA